MSAILARYVENVGRSAFLLDTIAKATLLLLAATAVTALLRRSSAAVRHWIWCLAFAALVLLPGLSAALPQWRLAVLPRHQLPAPRSELPLGGPLARQAEGALNHQASVPTESDSAGEPVPLAAQADNGSAKQAAYVTPPGREPELTTARRPSLALLWLIGTLLTLLPLLVGLVRMLLRRRQSQPIDGTSWTTLLDEIRLRLAIGRRVGLYENSSALMPMTWGVLRPVVVLPRHARKWTDHLRRIVLLHELAHVKRCDVGFQLLGRVVCALYWFHPLAWYALRRLRIERELACDDCVVLAGERATDYATNLLQIARDCRPVAFAAAIAMAQRSSLEHRVLALFDRACSHLPLGARAARLILLAVLLLVTTVAVVHLAPRAAAVTTDVGDVAVGAEAKADDKPAAQRAAKAGSPDDVSGKRSSARIELRGSVSGPSGRPLAGATVYVRRAVTGASDPPLSSATTDDRGRFQIGFTWPNSDERAGAKPDLVVVADAEGFAADWKYLHKEKSPGEMTLRLSNEQAIEGRIFNSEGKPLAGVELRVEELARYDHDTMRLLLDDVAQGRTILRTYKDWSYGPLPRQPAHVTTAADGRFRIAGLAADTVVKLRIRGAGVRETIFNASTAARDAIRGPVPAVEPPLPARGANVLYGSEIEYIAEPSRRIHGVVRDRETGRPVPGAKVSCSQEMAALGGGLLQIEAEADADGRYRLDGCGKEPRSIFNVDPPGDGPAYFPATMIVQDTPGLEPVVQDVDLVKGVELRGRIVDSETGEPLVASIQYAPLYLNTYAVPLYQQQANLHCHARSTTDGSFRIVVAPGPGALAVSHPSAASQEYITIRVSHDDVVKLFEASAKHRELARSAELKRGFPDAVPTQENAGWGLLGQAGNARTVLISPDEDKPPEPLEVRLIRGRTIRGQVVGPEGKPLTGATAYLDNPGIGSQLLSTADFQVTALSPEEKRALAFYHPQRKLGAFLAITADEPEPLTARLEPCATAVGRLVDAQGAAVEGVHVWFYRSRDYTSTELFSITDADGRFHIDQLIPGQPYEILRSEPGSRSRLQFSRAKVVFSVASGQRHDLGDLVVNGSDASAQPSTAVTLRGRVFLPDGKPAAQAGLFWLQFKAPPPRKPEDVVFEKRAVTDDEGRFELSLADNDVPLDKKQQRPLLAYKPGYGLDCVEIVEGQVPPDITLRMVEDRPIRGRVTDTEGRRVEGAKVVVTLISTSPDGSLDDFLAAWTKQWRNARAKLGKELYASRLLPLLTTATDREGRFELSGIGNERVASLTISAPGLVSEELQVVNREGFDAEKYNQAARAGMFPAMRTAGALPRLMGPVFDHVAETELVVRGKVFTGPDRKPVARAGVSSSGGGMRIGGASSAISTQTDEAGRFELRGLRRGQNSQLFIRGPQAGNLLFRSLPLDLAPGQTVVDVEVEMQQGVVVEGRVFDKVTGHGVRCGIQFVPLPANPFVDQPGFYSPNVLMGGNRTDDEGRFRILVMPGPGVLMAQAQNGGPPFGVNEPSPYRQATFSEEDSKRVTLTADGDNRYFAIAGNAGNRTRPLMNLNAAKVVDLTPQGGPVTCDLSLDPGKTATIAIEDERGQPVADAIVGGVADTWPMTVKIAKPTCTVYGLGADRPRHVSVLQTEGHLAGSLTLTGDEPEKVTVRLAATASIAGRALDGDGQPLGDAVLQVVYLRDCAGGAVELANRDKAPLKTDGDGRFLIENVLPGERLTVSFRQGDKFFGGPRITDEQRQLAPGEKFDLGDFKVKQ